MQSIDINQLLNQEQSKAASPTKAMMHFSPTYQALLSETRKAILFTNKNRNETQLSFLVNLNKNVFQLIEKKEDKSRSFNINFEKQFFTVGKRRGFQNDLSLLNERLKKVIGFILKHAPIVFVEKAPIENQTSEKKQEISEYFNINTKSFTEVKTVSEKMVHSLAVHLKHFLKTLTSIKPKTDTADNKLQTQLKNTETMFLELLENEQKIIITNSTKKQNKLNSIYTLVVTKEKTIYVEESNMTKNKIIFNSLEKIYTLNGEDLTVTSLDWFTRKLEHINGELINQKAEAFTGE